MFDPWRQESWDVNDTVAQTDPKADSDVGGFFQRLPEADYLPIWLSQRQSGALGQAEQSAATKALVHTNTPSVAHVDSLGRPVLAVAYNRLLKDGNPVESKDCTRSVLDIEGNSLAVIDALSRTAMTHDYDLLKNPLHQSSIDAGERWMLGEVAKKPIRGWNSRGFQARHSYDALRRPTQLFVQQGNTVEIIPEFTVYGEALTNPETQNFRGKLYQHYDEAGVTTSLGFDFKGNPLGSTRQLAIQYQQTVDWSSLVGLTDPDQIASTAAPLLQDETFTASTTVDALNRPAHCNGPRWKRCRSSLQ